MPDGEPHSTFSHEEPSSEINTKQVKQLAEKNKWEYVAEGFDNIVYADAERAKAFRLPKKRDGIKMIQRDAAVLSTLPKQEEITIPIPVVKKQDGVEYGEYPFVTGKQFEDLSPQEQRSLLLELVDFLNHLHAHTDPVLSTVPEVNCYEHFSLIYERVQEELTDILSEKQMEYAKKLFISYLAQYKHVRSALIHGDISFDHLYYDNGTVSIIDWSDMQRTDPAYEFHHLLRQLPKNERDIMREQYNTRGDESFWKRADVYTKIDTFDALLNFVKEKNTVHIQNFLDRIDQDMLDTFES